MAAAAQREAEDDANRSDGASAKWRIDPPIGALPVNISAHRANIALRTTSYFPAQKCGT
jgi:hypothetical protein